MNAFFLGGLETILPVEEIVTNAIFQKVRIVGISERGNTSHLRTYSEIKENVKSQEYGVLDQYFEMLNFWVVANDIYLCIVKENEISALIDVDLGGSVLYPKGE